jgi:monothiol glutaredoxin
MRATLDKVVGSSKVVLFMKGTKDLPQCGFSHTVVQILRSLDVLSNEALRQGLKEYSSWPTFPQLYIDGEFFGGCDITVGKLLYVLSIHSFTDALAWKFNTFLPSSRSHGIGN